MNPLKTDVHIDAALSNVSTAYMQDNTNFIAGTVFPRVPVAHRSNKYYVWNKDSFRLDQVRERADCTESAGADFSLSNSNYEAKRYALHKMIGREVIENADPAANVEIAASEWLAQQHLISAERKWATDFFATSKWATDVTGAASGGDFVYWSDQTGSSPLEDIDTGKATILQSTGLEPNTLVVGYEVHQALKNHPEVVERYKRFSPGAVGTGYLATLLEVDRYLVAKASWNSAIEGATASNAFILGKNALLMHVTDTPALMNPTAGYTFTWDAFGGFNPNSVPVKRIPNADKDCIKLEAEQYYDQKIVGSDLGYFFSGAIA